MGEDTDQTDNQAQHKDFSKLQLSKSTFHKDTNQYTEHPIATTLYIKQTNLVKSEGQEQNIKWRVTLLREPFYPYIFQASPR